MRPRANSAAEPLSSSTAWGSTAPNNVVIEWKTINNSDGARPANQGGSRRKGVDGWRNPTGASPNRTTYVASCSRCSTKTDPLKKVCLCKLAASACDTPVDSAALGSDFQRQSTWADSLATATDEVRAAAKTRLRVNRRVSPDALAKGAQPMLSHR